MRGSLVLVLLCVADVRAQTWTDLMAEPRPAPVRVHEVGGFADGQLLLVKDDDLTILRSERPLVIPKSVIARVETRRRDSPVEGAVIGALANVSLGVTGGWQGCSDSKCATIGIPVWAALGALIDWSIREKRTVYRAP